MYNNIYNTGIMSWIDVLDKKYSQKKKGKTQTLHRKL